MNFGIPQVYVLITLRKPHAGSKMDYKSNCVEHSDQSLENMENMEFPNLKKN